MNTIWCIGYDLKCIYANLMLIKDGLDVLVPPWICLLLGFIFSISFYFLNFAFLQDL